MANINLGAKPQLADVHCSRLTFQPGDRILVRSFRKLDPAEEKRLRSSICKWAGVELEIFIYDATQMDIQVDRNAGGLIKP